MRAAARRVGGSTAAALCRHSEWGYNNPRGHAAAAVGRRKVGQSNNGSVRLARPAPQAGVSSQRAPHGACSQHGALCRGAVRRAAAESENRRRGGPHRRAGASHASPTGRPDHSSDPRFVLKPDLHGRPRGQVLGKFRHTLSEVFYNDANAEMPGDHVIIKLSGKMTSYKWKIA